MMMTTSETLYNNNSMSTPKTTSTATTTRMLAKHQGYLLRKRKFIGFKETYVVLQKGHLIYYHSDSDAQSDHNRKGTYSLECATIEEYQNSSPSNYLSYSWTINFPDGRQHTLCSLMSTSKKMGGIPKTPSVSTAACSKVTSKISPGKSPLNPSERKKKWIDAFKQHIEYMEAHPEINSYQRQLSIVPIERIEQQMNILKMDQERVNQTLSQIEKDLTAFSTANLNQLTVDPNLYKCVSNYKPNFDILKLQIQVFIEDTNKCLSLQDQKDSILQTQLADTKAKCRLLEESLRSLAHENETESKPPKNIKRSPSSSIGGDVVVAGSSSNTTESDSSDFDEYYDTAEEADHNNNHHDNKYRRSEKRHSAYQTVMEMCNTEIKRPTNGNYIEDVSEEKSENSTNRDSGIGSEVVVVKAGSSSSLLTPSSADNDASWRISLPAPMIDRSQISLWTIAKHFIGKELTKISMPVFLCEPLSFLQRIGENTQYSPLLTSLFDVPDPCKRMEIMAAYSIGICSSIERISKPFNPLLGETYELIREDLGFRSVSEQVSHHPPISAYHTEALDKSRYWSSYGSVNPKIKFWGKSVEVDPRGTVTCDFPSLNETYFWKPATCTIHNVIVGTPWFEYTGTMEVKCLQTGYKAVLTFRPYSRSNKELHKVDGYIYDAKGNKLKAIYGYWTHCIYSCDVESFDNFVEAKKPLPMAKFDKYFNVVEPLIPLNTHDSSRNLSPSNGGGSLSVTTPVLSTRLSTQSVPRFNLSSVDGDGDDEAESEMSSNVGGGGRPLSQQLSHQLSPQPLAYLSQLTDSSKAMISSVSSLSTLMKDLCEIWKVSPQPPYSAEKFYNFSYFAMSLNELKPGMEKVLAPTDTRFRSDVRRLEYGDLDGASREKDRLEVKQRDARKNQVGEYKPKWFYQGRHAQTGEEEWVFTDKYWLRDYSDCPDIY